MGQGTVRQDAAGGGRSEYRLGRGDHEAARRTAGGTGRTPVAEVGAERAKSTAADYAADAPGWDHGDNPDMPEHITIPAGHTGTTTGLKTPVSIMPEETDPVLLTAVAVGVWGAPPRLLGQHPLYPGVTQRTAESVQGLVVRELLSVLDLAEMVGLTAAGVRALLRKLTRSLRVRMRAPKPRQTGCDSPGTMDHLEG